MYPKDYTTGDEDCAPDGRYETTEKTHTGTSSIEEEPHHHPTEEQNVGGCPIYFNGSKFTEVAPMEKAIFLLTTRGIDHNSMTKEEVITALLEVAEEIEKG